MHPNPLAMLVLEELPLEAGMLTEEELAKDVVLDAAEEKELLLEEDDTFPDVAETPTTSMTIMGDVRVCAHWMANVMDFVTVTVSLPLTGTLRLGPHGDSLPSVSHRCTPLDVQEMTTVLPRGAFTVPSCPLIFTSMAENPPCAELLPALEFKEKEEENDEEEDENGSAHTSVSIYGWREHAAERTKVLPFQYSMKLSPQLAKFLLTTDCTRAYPARLQILWVVAASSSIATPS